MSIITPEFSQTDGSFKDVKPTILTPENVTKGLYTVSQYNPSEVEKTMRQMIIQHFTLGYTNMYTPRVEFNDLSTIQRMTADQMAFNTYQPNNGQPAWGDIAQAWRSNAMRPIVRNKCVSIAAHATARLIFPKCFAYNSENDEQQDAAQVMEDLMEWSADKSNYANHALYRTVTALTDPASIGYTEYCETYRKVKRPKAGGGYTEEVMLDETLSGFQNVVVPVDELFIENFYESDIQKQGWLVWRRVMSYSLVEAKYKTKYANFTHVKPGVQLLLNDANQTFYQVYDTNMRPYDAEEIIYWNRSLDVKIIMVNGVMLTEHDASNPRNDKLYPFDKFGYELINNRCFYYKSLAFKMMHDANIINTLYPMIIDGTYLNLMPPMVQIGDEVIGSDVIVPGAVTTLQSKDADLRAITTSNNLTAGLNALAQVEASIDETSTNPIQEGQSSGKMTAYELSRLEANAATVLGLFIQMIGQHVKDFGKLRLGDIIQYLTVVDADKITGNAPLVYKTFLLRDKMTNGRSATRKIKFTADMPMEKISTDDQLSQSYDVLQEQGGSDSNTELYKVNPELFRDLTYMLTVSPDVLNPKSEELERQFDLDTYDRAIMNPMADQEEVFRLLLSTNPRTRKNPDKYVMQQDPNAIMMGGMMPPGGAPTAQPPIKPPGGLPQTQPLTPMR